MLDSSPLNYNPKQILPSLSGLRLIYVYVPVCYECKYVCMYACMYISVSKEQKAWNHLPLLISSSSLLTSSQAR